MNFKKKRALRRSQDRAYMQAAGVKQNDPVADRFAGGNVYSSEDIDALTRERLRKRRRSR